jgi:predicted ArsR family transcriptional regulator
VARTKVRPDNPSEEFFREKIIINLKRYPSITVSMLSVHVRPYGSNWRQVLENMINEGIVERKVVIADVSRAITTYRLKEIDKELSVPELNGSGQNESLTAAKTFTDKVAL